jgi:hypothetical protein
MVDRGGVGLSRRGQNAANTAILVAIIGGLLVGYILFLPPADREQLLFGSGGSGGGSWGGGGGGVFTQYGPVLVFRDTPGTLRMQKSTIVEHPIPSATIFSRVNTQVLRSVDSALVRNSVFARQPLEVHFVAERDTAVNYLLSFNVDEVGEAPLRVLLNGNLVFERPIRQRSPAPIPLPVEHIEDGENILTIEAADVGLAFWQRNAYVLENVLLTADVIDLSNAASTGSFSIPRDELLGIEAAQLQFVPECDPKKAARLMVMVNTRRYVLPDNTTREEPFVAYSGIPDCGVQLKADVPPELLAPSNVVMFSSPGEYVIDRVKLVTRLQENEYPVYYFNLPRDMFDSLDAGPAQLRLTLTFADYRNVKTGEIVINGFVQTFSTQEYAYQAVIDPGILTPGPNTISVTPRVDRLDLAEIKIELM